MAMVVRGQCPSCGGSARVTVSVDPPVIGCDSCGHVAHAEPDADGVIRFPYTITLPPYPQRIVMLSVPDMDHGVELGEAGA